MASDTVPAAVPGPGDPAGTTPTSNPAPAPRGLAGLLSAVDPARPTGFNLNPTAGVEETAVNGASSAEFHTADTDTNTTTGKGNGGKGGRQERSVMRAWLLAGAERWKQGGAARVKRLEMQKARHQANQVKETRTVAVNRSGGFLGGGSKASGGGGNSGGGKSLTSKTSRGSASTGPKNSSGSNRNGSAGRSGGSGGSAGGSGAHGGAGRGASGNGAGRRGPSGNSGSGSGSRGTKGHGGSHNSGTSKPLHGKDNSSGHGKTQKPNTPKSGATGPKTNATGPKGGSSGSTSSSGKTGAQGAAGRSGKDGNTGASSGKTSTGTGPSTTGSKKDTAGKGGATKVDLAKKPTGKGSNGAAGQAPAKGNGTAPGTKLTKTPTGQTPPAAKRTPLQESRETGYRDGTRAAKAVAHVQAYRDGAKDGYRDTSEAAARDKQRLDKAHEDRKQKREKDQAVTGASSADYHPTQSPQQQTGPQQAQPVQVTGIDATHIHLGDGAARSSMTRGEVRTVKQFERRLESKADTMIRIADAAKAFGERDKERTKAITYLMEQARVVDGGEDVVADLTRLQEAATVREAKAAELLRRSVRGAESTRVLLSNVEARYGGMYKAVVDSPLTKPAETSYYRK
jgi:hypothetical protein